MCVPRGTRGFMNALGTIETKEDSETYIGYFERPEVFWVFGRFSK